MTNEPAVKGLGDFLDWPPSRYLKEGFYADRGKTELRQDLQGIFATKSAFRFRYEGIANDLARAYAVQMQQAAQALPAGAAILPASEALGHRLLAEPFAGRLFLYDFFRE